MFARSRQHTYRGFTIIELLVVIAIIAILVQIVASRLFVARDSALVARADTELRQLATALERYHLEENAYPEDLGRGIPTDLDAYLGEEDRFAAAPWANTVYDWNTYEVGGETVRQFTIHFCPVGATSTDDCNFPNQNWADDFVVGSTYFYCVSGPCQANPSDSASHPAYCTNCDCKEMAICNIGG